MAQAIANRTYGVVASLRAKCEKHLGCSICLTQLQDPKVLPCLHSFCHKCIMKLDRTDDKITCPACGNAVNVGDPDFSFLPSDLFAKNLITTLSLANDFDVSTIKCENCDKGSFAETRCEQCKVYLCKLCTRVHKSKYHNLKVLHTFKESGTTIRCPKHQNEVINVFCATCQSTICRDCAIVDHRGHDFSFIADVAEEHEVELQSLVEEMKGEKKEVSIAIKNVVEVEQNLLVKTVSTVEEINRYFEKSIKALHIQNNRLVAEAHSVSDAKLKQLHDQREQLEIMLTSCGSNITFAEQTIIGGNDVRILNMKKHISESLAILKDKNAQPCVDDHVKYVASLGTKEDFLNKTALTEDFLNKTALTGR